MKKSLLLVALVAACAIPVASFAATDPCKACKTTAKRADSTLRAKSRTLASLQRRLEQKVAYSQRKQESYDRKILDCRARADALTVKMSGCNATASFITTIWNSAATTSFTCTASNSILGSLLGTVEGTLDCAANCAVSGGLGGLLGGDSGNYSQCLTSCQQKNAALQAKCKNKATSTCSQIVRYRTKSEGYKTMKANYNPSCTGVSATACPNGTLRNIYILIHGRDGTDQTSGAQFEANKATTSSNVANASYECCQSGGTYDANTRVCTPKPTPTPPAA